MRDAAQVEAGDFAGANGKRFPSSPVRELIEVKTPPPVAQITLTCRPLPRSADCAEPIRVTRAAVIAWMSDYETAELAGNCGFGQGIPGYLDLDSRYSFEQIKV